MNQALENNGGPDATDGAPSSPNDAPMQSTSARGNGIDTTQFLVVDDYALVRRIVSESLKACGAKIIDQAQDAREAVCYLQRRAPSIHDRVLLAMMDARPDIVRDLSPENGARRAAHSTCVITDFNMEDGNGLDLLKAIRCGETNAPRDTPVILLTGYSDDFVIAAALELDVNAFIVKPVSHSALQDRVARVLKTSIQVKPARTYRTVEIPDEKGQIRSLLGGDKNAKPKWDEPAQDKDVRRLPIMAIQPGAVLAEDLRTERGALLMKAGTVLSAFVIQRLRDVADSDGLHGTIPIKGAA